MKRFEEIHKYHLCQVGCQKRINKGKKIVKIVTINKFDIKKVAFQVVKYVWSCYNTEELREWRLCPRTLSFPCSYGCRGRILK